MKKYDDDVLSKEVSIEAEHVFRELSILRHILILFYPVYITLLGKQKP